tara:strand:- start:26 stop:1570 length:1545 start_codon:yes stop_codon:yes gene_type:complete
MQNKFNVTQEEKNRIRNLHLTESGTKKIDSTLNEQDEKKDIRVDEPVVGDDMVKTDISIDDKEMGPLDNDGPEKSVLPAHYHVWVWCKTGQQKVMIASPFGGLSPSGGGTDLQTLSQIFYSSVGSPAPGQTVHIGNASGGGGTPREEFCLTYVGFEIRTQYLDSAVLAMTSTNVDGIFTGCQDCIQGGPQGGTIYCINCTLGQMTQVSQTQGCPPGYSDIGPNPSPPQGPCTECVQGNCTNIGYGYGQGTFNSMAECQASPLCSPPIQYECVNNTCAQQPGGQYSTLADCQNSGCGQVTNTYDCTDWTDPSGCQQVAGGNGQFATLDDCLTSPCQCDDVILAWPLYLNNPNNPQGNWYGTPSHDGPTNNNAIQNQLNNLQGNPNFPGGNPVQQHKMKCREAAMIFWLAQNSNTCTICSDPGFAVGAANNDPLGCVAQQFINMMDNFMVQHANWPNNGCNWLTNALTSAQTQQTQYNPGSNAYCKIQGKIDFLNNFINNGTSTYLTGTPTFTLGC